MKHKYFSY